MSKISSKQNSNPLTLIDFSKYGNNFIDNERYESIKNIYKKSSDEYSIDIKKVKFIVKSLNNYNLAVKFIVALDEHLIASKVSRSKVTRMIGESLQGLVDEYKGEKLHENPLLRKFNLSIRPEGGFNVKIGSQPGEVIPQLPELSKTQNIEKLLQMKSAAMSQIMYYIICYSDRETVQEFSEVFANTQILCMKLIPDLQKVCFSTLISLALPVVKVDVLSDVILQLKEIWINDHKLISGLGSQMLLMNNYDFIIDNILPNLPPIDKHNEARLSSDLSLCYTQIIEAYHAKGDYRKAIPYMNHIMMYGFEYIQLFRIHTDVYGFTDKLYEYFNRVKAPFGIQQFINFFTLVRDFSKISVKTFNEINFEYFKNVDPTDNGYYRNHEHFFKLIAQHNDAKLMGKAIDKIKIKNLLKNFKSHTSSSALWFKLALYFKDYELAKEWFKLISKDIIKANAYFEGAKLYFSSVEEKDIKKQIAELKISETGISKLNDLSSNLIADDKTNSALESTKAALECDSNNEEALEHGIASALLSKKPEEVREFSNKLTEEKKEEIINQFTVNGKTIDDLIEQFDAQKIHFYYQSLKNSQLNSINKSLNNSENELSRWNFSNKVHLSSDAFYIGKYRHLDTWAKISKKIETKIRDQALIAKFEYVLKEKGITHHASSVNGVKFIGNKCIECKIDGDMRVYTNIIHINDSGEHYIEFDHYGTHSDVKLFAETSHIDYQYET